MYFVDRARIVTRCEDAADFNIRSTVRSRVRTIAAVLLLTILAGCATLKTPEEQAAEYVAQAHEYATKGDRSETGRRIDSALTRPTGSALVKKLFAADAIAQDTYLAYLRDMIAALSNPYQASELGMRLAAIERDNVLPPAQVTVLRSNFEQKVTAGNVTGTIPFKLSNGLVGVEFLNAPTTTRIIVDRSIAELQSQSRISNEIAPLVAYVGRVGPSSAEGQRIEKLLPSMHIKLDELDDIARVFPQFASARRDELTVPVLLLTKGADRLFLDDLRNALDSKLHVLRWVASPAPGTTVLTIERARYEERTLPEHTETVTYADYQVNLIAAALLMPRNASYRFDVASGGAEIEYGYVVTATQDGKQIFERVVRGKASQSYRRCQNARIQNVFGGVSPAGFVANDDMRARCSGPNSATLDSLRQNVLAQLADAVGNVPTISAVRQ